MQLVYTQENRLLVEHVKNLLEQAGIAVYLKNEFIGGAAGELAPLDTWLEIWVQEQDVNQAIKLIEQSFEKSGQPEWLCSNCGERNAPSFDICWQCQQPAAH